MKKAIFVILCVALFVAMPVALLAQEGKDDAKGSMMHGKMMGQDMDKGMWHEMIKVLHDKLVATEDGGVVLLMGNRLTKYDRDLNLIKEVELKFGPPPGGMGMGDQMKGDSEKR